MNAKLPESLESIGLKDMVDGESFYTLPWAMYADLNGSLWLNGDYPIEDKPHGTATMKVTKRNGMYVCDVRKCREHRWKRGGGAFVGEFTPLPVSEVFGM